MVSTATFISDTVLFIRDDLLNNITDPISSTRPATQKFVMTSYPQRRVTYPIITVQVQSIDTGTKLGMQSELHFINIPLEVRVWARNVKERDELGQNVMNRLRQQQFGTGSTTNNSLFGFEITSSVNIDEGGDAGVHSKVMAVNYRFILGA